MTHLPFNATSKDPSLSNWSNRRLRSDKRTRRTLSESGNQRSMKEVQERLAQADLAKPLKGHHVGSPSMRSSRSLKLDSSEFKNQWVMARILRKDQDGIFVLAAANPKRHKVTRIGHFITKQVRISSDGKVQSDVVPFESKVKGKKVLVEIEGSNKVVFGTAKSIKHVKEKLQLILLAADGIRHNFDIQKILLRGKLNLLSDEVYNYLEKNPGKAKCVLADDRDYMHWCGDDPGAGAPFLARFEKPQCEKKMAESSSPPKARRTKSAFLPSTKLSKSPGKRNEKYTPGTVIETLILSGRCKGLWVKAKVVSVNTLQRTAELEVLSPSKWKVAKRAVSVPFRLIQHVPESKKNMYIVPISIVQDNTFLCMPCEATTTVKQLRRDVGLQIGYSASRITFIFRGAKLTDEASVPDGALFCVVSQKGGMTEKDEKVLEEASSRKWGFSLPSFSIQDAYQDVKKNAPKMPNFTVSPPTLLSLMDRFSVGRSLDTADHDSLEEKKEEMLPEDLVDTERKHSNEEDIAADRNEDKPLVTVEDPLASSGLSPRVVALSSRPKNLQPKKGFSQRALDMFGVLRGSIHKDVNTDSNSNEDEEPIAEKIRRELNALNASDGELELASAKEDCLP